jgi:hypothetical protein
LLCRFTDDRSCKALVGGARAHVEQPSDAAPAKTQSPRHGHLLELDHIDYRAELSHGRQSVVGQVVAGAEDQPQRINELVHISTLDLVSTDPQKPEENR